MKIQLVNLSIIKGKTTKHTTRNLSTQLKANYHIPLATAYVKSSMLNTYVNLTHNLRYAD